MSLILTSACAVAALVAASFTQWRNTQLRAVIATQKAALGDLLNARQYPYRVKGFSVAIRSAATAMLTSRNYKDAAPRRKLILASNDSCGGCRENLTRWESLLSRIPPNEDIEVLLVTFGGRAFPSRLTKPLVARNIPFTILAVTKPLYFTLTTGIIGVPFTAILDSEDRLNACTEGVLDNDSLGILASLINEPNPSVVGARIFLRRGRSERALLVAAKSSSGG